MPTLFNTAVCACGKRYEYDSTLKDMLVHSGEIVTALLYITWHEVFCVNNEKLPFAIDLTDDKIIAGHPGNDLAVLSGVFPSYHLNFSVQRL